MSNKIVKYHNDFNQLVLKDFTSKELDLFMALFVIAKEQGTKKITLKFEDLKKISQYDNKQSYDKFISNLTNMNKKLLDLKFMATSEDGLKIIQFVLFNCFEIDLKQATCTIGINEHFNWILNDLTSEFTRFELEEFINLKSQYAKTAYRLLKQFRSTGYWTIAFDDFRTLMNVPSSYKTCNINTRVLKPIINELSPIFNKLKINKITQGKGGKITRLEFVWVPDKINNVINTTDKSNNKNPLPKKKTLYKDYIKSNYNYDDKHFFDIFE